MYEIIIIICLGLALFLLLRHYPEAAELNEKKAFWLPKFNFDFLKGLKKKKVEEIERAIEAGQAEIVAPVETEKATILFKESDPEVAEILFKAHEAFELNDLRVAEDKAIEAITKNKRCADAYVIIGKIAYSRGQFDDAKESFLAALKCDKEIGEAYFGLGEVEYRNENISGAIEHFQKAVNFDKRYPDWYATLGKVYMEARQYAKAAKVLKRAASLDIDNKEYRELSNEAEEKQRTHSYYSRYKK